MEPVCELKNKREGINSASAYVAVMDGDLQHDEQLLPHNADVLRREPVDRGWQKA
jgi:hypothetical protein